MVLLYETVKLQGEFGAITDVNYPSEAVPGTSVYTTVSVFNPTNERRAYLASLVNAVTLEELAFGGWEDVAPGVTETWGLTRFTMPNEPLTCVMRLYEYDRNNLVDVYGPFTIQIPLFQLTVRSDPLGVPVSVDGVQGTTPVYYEVTEGTYTVTVPSTFGSLVFSRWENNSIEPQRVIVVAADSEIAAYYEAPPNGNGNGEPNGNGENGNGNGPSYLPYIIPLAALATVGGVILLRERKKNV